MNSLLVINVSPWNTHLCSLAFVAIIHQNDMRVYAFNVKHGSAECVPWQNWLETETDRKSHGSLSLEPRGRFTINYSWSKGMIFG